MSQHPLVRDHLPWHRRLHVEPLEDRLLLSITVNTVLDENNGVGVGAGTSLREAIDAAVSGDTVDFSVTGTINLTNLGQLVINKDLTISGPGANLLTINAFDPTPTVKNADGRRVFYLFDGILAANRNVTISGLTISGGDSFSLGGGIDSAENLTIRACVISNNSGGQGGAVSNSRGNLTVVDSTLSGNRASLDGGGIWNNGSTTVLNSTLSGNSANSKGGGLWNFDGGTSIRHSTITGNSAPAGAGSGVGSFGSFYAHTEVYSSIIAGNTASDVDYGPGTFNSLQSLGYNLIGKGNALPNFNQPGDQTNVASPLLGPLGFYGGTTKTQPPLAGSPALDGGNPAAVAGAIGVPTFDQRGAPFSRVFDVDGFGGARIDIGAVEQRLLTYTVDTLVDENDGNFVVGDLSLREAITLANASVNVPDQINFSPALNGGRILLTQGELLITDAVTINGPGANLLSVDASGNDPTPAANDSNGSRVFNINNFNGSLIPVVIAGLTITGGDLSGPGGGVGSLENLTVTGCTVEANFGLEGGGIYSNGGNLTIAGCMIRNNVAGLAGGGVQMLYGIGSITNSTISGNSADSSSAIQSCDATLAIASSMITGNSTNIRGSIGTTRCDFTLTSSTVSGGSHVGFWQTFGKATVSSSLIMNNMGGGIYVNGELSVIDSTISGNSSPMNGGGIKTEGVYSRLVVENSTISGNSAGGSGGGISATILSNVTISNSTISGNSALQSGGGLHNNDSTVDVRFSTITLNTVPVISFNQLGGGINGIASLYNSIVAGNLNFFGPDDILGNVTARYSLIGDSSGAGISNNGGNLIGAAGAPIDPKLGPLADNGGPRQTHALLAGSPATDAGDPAAAAVIGIGNIPLYDGRGAPYTRAFDGDGLGGPRVDIGAFEVQTTGPALPGDYNQNGVVDTIDYVLWRNSLGQTVSPLSSADGSGNGLVDQPDYQVWRSNFGKSLPATAPAVAAAKQNEGAASHLASDAWFGLLAVEAESRSAASAISTGSAAVPTYPSGTVDLLLVLDAVPIDVDTIPLDTDALDAAFSAEDDEAALSDPSAVSLASL